jgi:hypothetical protein
LSPVNVSTDDLGPLIARQDCFEHVREEALIIRDQDADRRAWRATSNHLPTYALY